MIIFSLALNTLFVAGILILEFIQWDRQIVNYLGKTIDQNAEKMKVNYLMEHKFISIGMGEETRVGSPLLGSG